MLGEQIDSLKHPSIPGCEGWMCSYIIFLSFRVLSLLNMMQSCASRIEKYRGFPGGGQSRCAPARPPVYTHRGYATHIRSMLQEDLN